jgi:hypothetical protein
MPGKHDVNTYMAIRWYVNTIENLAISTYAGYPARKDDIMSYLKNTAMSLELLSKGPARPPLAKSATPATSASQIRAIEIAPGSTREPDTDCPWQTCKDGACRPSCTISPK